MFPRIKLVTIKTKLCAHLQAPVACKNIHTAGGCEIRIVQDQTFPVGLKIDIGNHYLIGLAVFFVSRSPFADNIQPI